MIPVPYLFGNDPLTDLEYDLAILAIDTLRSCGCSDAEIISDYTPLSPLADHAYERAYFEETGICIAAHRVKAQMRRLLTH